MAISFDSIYTTCLIFCFYQRRVVIGSHKILLWNCRGRYCLIYSWANFIDKVSFYHQKLTHKYFLDFVHLLISIVNLNCSGNHTSNLLELSYIIHFSWMVLLIRILFIFLKVDLFLIMIVYFKSYYYTVLELVASLTNSSFINCFFLRKIFGLKKLVW